MWRAKGFAPRTLQPKSKGLEAWIYDHTPIDGFPKHVAVLLFPYSKDYFILGHTGGSSFIASITSAPAVFAIPLASSPELCMPGCQIQTLRFPYNPFRNADMSPFELAKLLLYTKAAHLQMVTGGIQVLGGLC